jgi:hypothetical protein
LQKKQPRLDLKRLVFIDETSVSTTITRLYGRAPQGNENSKSNSRFKKVILAATSALGH